jgi:Skp family chaperone for outer membrane proteins
VIHAPGPKTAPFALAVAVALASALALQASQAVAQDEGSAPPAAAAARRLSVAIIDSVKAIDASKDGKSAAGQIRSRHQKLEERLAKLRSDTQAKAEKLEKDSSGLSTEEIQSRWTQIQREVESVQAETAKAETQMKSALEAAYGPLYDRASKAASDFAQAHGLLLVLENSDEDKAVIFSDPSVIFVDITEDVTKLLDGAKAPAKAPAGKPAAKPARKKR